MKLMKWVAPLAVMALLSGCTTTPAPQVVALEEAGTELGVNELDDVICDSILVPPPFPMTRVDYKRIIELPGDDRTDELVDLLLAHGYTLTSELDAVVVRFAGPDGITAGVASIPADDEFAGKTLNYNGDESCDIPEIGSTSITLTLPS